ncbi:MAG: 4-alpha-glucanotransferase [PVC group bacterium]
MERAETNGYFREEATIKFRRGAGILLHITSLPGPHGIGSLGREAYQFVDWLADAGQRFWEVLPINPIGYGNSPYSSPSAFAGAPSLISLERLVETGYLLPEDLPPEEIFPKDRVDFPRAIRIKKEAIGAAFRCFRRKTDRRQQNDFDDFRAEHSPWLDNYALYKSIKDHFQGAPWYEWPAEIAFREPAALRACENRLEEKISESRFAEFLFFKQWKRLRGYCNETGIKLIGDIPFLVSYDSADVWVHRHLFLLDEHGRRRALSGVPPTGHSGVSQIWGNPLYDWVKMSEDRFNWWMRRFRTILELTDVVRVDHFSGFTIAWHIPPEAKTSAEGQWFYGPGAALFGLLEKQLGTLPIIAEALEPVHFEETKSLMEILDFSSTRVIQFAFLENDRSPHLPENYPFNCAAYTGTHDTDTICGWFASLRDEETKHVLSYFGTDHEEINWKFIRRALSSVADLAVIPLQDVLGLGSEARMNAPGRESGQWEWRYDPAMLTGDLAKRLAEMTRYYGR